MLDYQMMNYVTCLEHCESYGNQPMYMYMLDYETYAVHPL